jgi:predicted GNAT superfamily acetyltransferase
LAGGEEERVIEIRSLTKHAEWAEAVRLQKIIWGFEEIELLPLRLFVVASKVGGQTFGAFDGQRMAGFLIAIPGLKADGQVYLHSHMMGVMADYRNAGIGRLLKLSQRQEALARGIRLVEWTFDPLEIKNAWFNIQKLGAVVRRYVLNQYGTTTSHLHGGLPTDRCVAEWHLDSPRVQAILAGSEPDSLIDDRIEVPATIATFRQTDPERACGIQKAVSERFLACFSHNLEVTGFRRTDESGTYLLSARQ